MAISETGNDFTVHTVKLVFMQVVIAMLFSLMSNTVAQIKRGGSTNQFHSANLKNSQHLLISTIYIAQEKICLMQHFHMFYGKTVLVFLSIFYSRGKTSWTCSILLYTVKFNMFLNNNVQCKVFLFPTVSMLGSRSKSPIHFSGELIFNPNLQACKERYTISYEVVYQLQYTSVEVISPS